MLSRFRLSLIAAGLFIFSFAIYLITLAPVVTFVDSGELAAVVATQGVSHPTGSPLYLLLAAVVEKIPAASLIVRLNAFSAFCAAASTLFTFYLFLSSRWSEPRLVEKGKKKKKKVLETPPLEAQSNYIFAGVAASLAWASNLALWNTATVTEVYTLHLLLVAAFCFFLITYARHSIHQSMNQAGLWLAVSALTAGLAVSNYPPFVILAPAVLYLLIRIEGLAVFAKWKRNALLIGCVAAGLLPYLLLPVRARTDPLLNWGNPSNWENFLAHVSAEQYQVFLGSPSFEVLQRLFPLWWDQWPGPLVLLALPGLVLLWRKHRIGFYFTTIIALTNLLYSLSYDVTDVESAPSDFETYFLPLFWISSLWIGAGILAMRFLLRQDMRQRRAVSLLALLPLAGFVFNWKQADRSNYTYADDFSRSILSSVAQNAFILCPDWTFVSPSLYLQHGENFRTDVVVLDGELLRRSWYFGYVRKRAPWLYEKAGSRIEEFLQELRKFETDEPYDGNLITQKYVVMMNAFLAASYELNHPTYILLNLEARDLNLESYHYLEEILKRPPYFSPGVDPGIVGSEFEWIPETPAFRLYPIGSFREPLTEIDIPPRPIDPNRKYDKVTGGVIRRYANFWRWRGDYYRSQQDCSSARIAYQKSLSIVPEWQESKEGLALCSK